MFFSGEGNSLQVSNLSYFVKGMREIMRIMTIHE